MKRIKKSRISKHSDVVAARSVVNACHAELKRNETEEFRDKFKTAKKNLFATYDRLKEEELAERMREVEAANEGKKHGA